MLWPLDVLVTAQFNMHATEPAVQHATDCRATRGRRDATAVATPPHCSRHEARCMTQRRGCDRHVSPNKAKARQVPVDMVTQRMMVQGPRPSAPNAHQYKSGIEAIRRIARSEGILGAPALLRTVAAVCAAAAAIRTCATDWLCRSTAALIRAMAACCAPCHCWARPALPHGRQGCATCCGGLSLLNKVR